MKQRIVACIMALILCVSLVPSSFAAAPTLEDSIDMDQLVKHGIQVIGSMESGGAYNSVVNIALDAQNNKYVVGMGIFGWIGSSALQLLKWICDDSPEFSRQTLGNALYNEIVKAPVVDPATKMPNWNYWLSRTFTNAELSAAQTLLASDAGVRMQNHLAGIYLRAQARRGWDAGVRSEAALLYYCSADNHYGPGDVQKFMAGVRTALGLKNQDTINTLDQFHNGVLAAAQAGNTTVKKTLAYREKIYKYITENLTFSDEPSSDVPFVDMPNADDWFYDAVVWAYEAEPRILRGTSDASIAAEQTVTRGEAVTFLWRAAGEPEPQTEENPFEDVKKGKFYYKAVLWAVESGITKGTSATSFSPNEPVRRGHMLTFLWRFSESPASEDVTIPFIDVESKRYYYDAVLWAYHNGILVGNESSSDELLCVSEGCSRAYVVTYLYNCLRQTDAPQQ